MPQKCCEHLSQQFGNIMPVGWHVVKRIAVDWVEKHKPQLIEISDKIWELAELGLLEFKSAALLADTLEEYGFQVQRGVADMPTAFVAEFGKGRPIIGMMGEYDALPGLSQKAVPTREPIIEGAPGHGCGHNIHGTSALGGAIATKIAMEQNNLKGTIRFYGTPAEENYGGKLFLIRDGFFDDVDAVISHHPGRVNSAFIGSSNAIKSCKFHFYGKTAHAAGAPELGRSALDAIELMNVGVNFLREHIIDDARIHYVIEQGGTQPNIVPDYARSWYFVRAPEMDQLEFIYQRILKIANGADLMTGTTHTVEEQIGYQNVIPNKKLSTLIITNMREIGPPQYDTKEIQFSKIIIQDLTLDEKRATLRTLKHPRWDEFIDVTLCDTVEDPWDEGLVWPASSDVGDVSWKAPTLEFYTTTSALVDPFHSWRTVAHSGMSIGHKSLIFAAKTLATTALDLLTKPEALRQVQEEFKKRMKGKIYKSPLPPDMKPPHDLARKQADSYRPPQ